VAFVSISGFSLSFGKQKVLKNIYFALGEEKVAIIGESGSGKSLLAQSLIRMQPKNATVSASSWMVCGLDLQNASEKELQHLRRKKVSYAPQDAKLALNPLRTVGSQLAEIPSLESVDESLKKMHFSFPEKISALYPYQLSGGMASRVLLAMTLRSSPRVLIFDEGLSSLDELLQEKMLTLLEKSLAEKKMGLLLITHNISHARNFCDRLIILQEGEIAAEGSFFEVKKCKNPYVQKLLEL